MEQDKVKKSRRRFDQQFKVDAVRLLSESGKSVSEVARNLGIGRTQLEDWKKQLLGNKSPLAAFPGNGNIGGEKKELEELRRELARVKEEREILKKAAMLKSKPHGFIPFWPMMFEHTRMTDHAAISRYASLTVAATVRWSDGRNVGRRLW